MTRSTAVYARRALAVAGSGLVHVGLLLAVPEAPTQPVMPDWRQSVMVDIVEPEPVVLPPEPEPEVEPPALEPVLEPPPPEPEVVRADQLVADSVPDAPTPVDAPVPDAADVVQGLSASSFVEGGNSGLSLRAGTTLRAAATAPALHTPVERPEALAWSDAPKRPKCRVPKVAVPESVVEAGLEGEVHVRFDIDAEGTVSRVRVVQSLSPDADAACAAAWTTTHCRPARRGRTPVAVVDMPHSCLFRAMD